MDITSPAESAANDELSTHTVKPKQSNKMKRRDRLANWEPRESTSFHQVRLTLVRPECVFSYKKCSSRVQHDIFCATETGNARLQRIADHMVNEELADLEEFIGRKFTCLSLPLGWQSAAVPIFECEVRAYTREFVRFLYFMRECDRFFSFCEYLVSSQRKTWRELKSDTFEVRQKLARVSRTFCLIREKLRRAD